MRGVRGINMSPIRANLTDFVVNFHFLKICKKSVKKSGPEMNHFLSFSQRPSPQASWDPPSGQELISLVSWDKFSSRLDQMAPHSCPFLVSNFEVFQKPRSRPPLPSKNHHGKNGKHHFTPVFVLNQLDPILPMETFVYIGWEQGQKAGRHIRANQFPCP